MLLQNQTATLCFLMIFLFLGKITLAQMYDDSLATDRHLQKISATAFMNAVLLHTQNDRSDPLKQLERLGLYLDSECDEICETYLKEKEGKGKMLLPSDFDQGVMGMVFSPSDKSFVIYSSYDGPDYDSFYHYRAEVMVYPIVEGVGLDAIGKPQEYHLYDWSIEEIFWIDDKTVALKAYQGSRAGSEAEGGYSYLKLPLR